LGGTLVDVGVKWLLVDSVCELEAWAANSYLVATNFLPGSLGLAGRLELPLAKITVRELVQVQLEAVSHHPQTSSREH